MYLPVQYPAWVNGGIVENEEHHRAVAGADFVPLVAVAVHPEGAAVYAPSEYPKWVNGELAADANAETAILLKSAPEEDAPKRRGRPPGSVNRSADDGGEGE